jgi:hypothetical protein
MRSIGLADIEVAARVLMCVPSAQQANVIRQLLSDAHVADKYRKRLRRMHPQFGTGSLMSAAQAHPCAKRFETIGDDEISVFQIIFNALEEKATYHKA